MTSQDIAIVGMSALFAGAKDLQTYWQNIINKVNAVQDATDDWAKPYFDPKSTENNRIYTRKGGFIGELAEFNPMEFGVMPNSVDGSDPAHFLALKVARTALEDADYIKRPFNREKTGIILGGGSYVNRGWGTLMQHGLVLDQTIDLIAKIMPGIDEQMLDSIRQEMQASLPDFTAEMAPGITPNVIPGRIANRLDINGPNYIIDAACASSLIAIELAIKELRSERCDMMLAGGIYTANPPQINMVFCRLGALSRSEIRPFDRQANGTLLGEGVGMLVLKRLADAARDGDRIYAVIKGVGISSDGKALGLLAPREEGEVIALKRAYGESEVNPKTVNLIEAHGTGIPLGDKTEVSSLTRIFGKRTVTEKSDPSGRVLLPNCALGSVKSTIGHCLQAAGAAGTIKAALALYHKLLPPTLCDRVNPDLEIEKTNFYINTEPRPWIHGNKEIPRRAGVNAFGFGGINAHIVLEEYRGKQATKQLHNQWPTELFIFAATEREGLIEKAKKVLRLLEQGSSLASLAYKLSREMDGIESLDYDRRLAIIAKDSRDLQTKINRVVEKLAQPNCGKIKTRNGIYYAPKSKLATPDKTALLFPGEGSQYPNMLADLCLYFPQVRSWFDFLDEIFGNQRNIPPSSLIFPPPTCLTEQESSLATEQLFKMDWGSEAVFAANMALYELLQQLGIQTQMMVGHSTGENTALIASGTVRWKNREELGEKIIALNQVYRDLVATDSIPKASLLAVGAVDADSIEQLIDSFGGRLHLAMKNCPNQVVICGEAGEVDAAAKQLEQAGGIYTRLAFDRAYHTPLFAGVSAAFKKYYDTLDVGPGHTPIYSCASTQEFPTDPEAIRVLAAQQWSSQVRFSETIETLYKQGIRTFVEVGPSRNLTGFVNDILRDREGLALASNSKSKSGLEQLQNLIACLFVNGAPVNIAPFYQQRELSQVKIDEESDEEEKQKASPILDLTLPIMRLQPEFAQQIHRQLSPVPAGTDAGTEDIGKLRLRGEETAGSTAESYPEDPPIANTPGPGLRSGPLLSPDRMSHGVDIGQIRELGQYPEDTGAHQAGDNVYNIHGANLQGDDRLKVVNAHFELMQEFLASQGRVMSAMCGRLGETQDADLNGALVPRTGTYARSLLGEIIKRDSQQLYCERRFDLEEDIFLYDHTIGGELSQRHRELIPLPVIPFAVSMEMLAEAAVYLVGPDKYVVGMENICGYRWLALDRGELVLGIEAWLQPESDVQQPSVKVRLFQIDSEEEGKRIGVFEGTVKLAPRFPPKPAAILGQMERPSPSRWTDEQLYSTGMFHGPRFQGVEHIRCWDDRGMEADLRTIGKHNFFRSEGEPVFQIDAGLVDAAGQLVGYWVSEQFGLNFHIFPFRVAAFHQYQPPLPPNSSVLCRARMSFVSDRQVTASFEILDRTGSPIARLEGWQDRYFGISHNYYQCHLHPQTSYLSEAWMEAETNQICRRIDPLPEGFLEEGGSIWKRVLAHIMLNYREREFWYNLPEGSQRADWLLESIAAKDALRQWAKQTYNLELAPVDIEILFTAMNKPLVHCRELEAMGVIPDIAIDRSGGYILAAVAQQNRRIGIAIASLEVSRDWYSSPFTQQELALLADGDEARLLGWCAKEAAAKASGTRLPKDPTGWYVTDYSRDRQQVTVTHGHQSFQVKVWHRDNEVIAICQC